MVRSVKFRSISSAERQRANVFAPLELAQKFIRKWVDEKRPGKVVFTSSVAGLISGSRGQASYFASKHALQCIAESLQEELQPFNI